MMMIDFDAMMKQEDVWGEAGTLIESRCYKVLGTIRMLDALEQLMRRIEWIGEQEITRVVTVFVDGRHGARLEICSVNRWIEDGDIIKEGVQLPSLKDEDVVHSHYTVDIGCGGLVAN